MLVFRENISKWKIIKNNYLENEKKSIFED